MAKPALTLFAGMILSLILYFTFAWYASSPERLLPVKGGGTTFHIVRMKTNPIIHHQMDGMLIKEAERFGYVNINGPCLMRVPSWVKEPLGKYYLYFAHHKGDSIRLAYADSLSGPWCLYAPGALKLENSLFAVKPPEQSPIGRLCVLFKQVSTTEFWTLLRVGIGEAKAVKAREAEGDSGSGILHPHIASPDIFVDDQKQEIRLYFHGMDEGGIQQSRVALSKDGLVFKVLPDMISAPYLRVFLYRGIYYGIAMPGLLYRSKNGLSDFEVRPKPLSGVDIRHIATRLSGSTLDIFWTRVGDAPERVLFSQMDVSSENWRDWKMSEPVEVLRPEAVWEGADLPLEPSLRGEVTGPANQLRDPFIFADEGRIFLLYSGAGEQAIGIAELR